jgi:hypothetical protein
MVNWIVFSIYMKCMKEQKENRKKLSVNKQLEQL